MKAQIFRRLSIAVLAVVLVAAVSVALLLPTTAQAYKNNESPASIGEIFIDNATTGGTFDKTKLQELLTKLGATGSTLDAMVTNLQGTVDASYTRVGATGSTRDYNDTKQIASQGIILEFGGIKWLATFLSLADQDLVGDQGSTGNKPGAKDVILTLWQAEVTNTTENQATWSDNSVSGFGTSTQNTNHTYPANMYGTSKIRAVTLNNGGSYTTNGTNLVSTTQSNQSKYAKFNMSQYMDGDSLKNSNISKFLVAPRYLDWQKNLRIPSDWNWTNAGGSFNNEGWGIHGANEFYSNGTTRFCYEDKGNYDVWKDDLIWIPASGEVGNFYSSRENSGIWGTSQDQRRVAGGESSVAVWLRTASYVNYYHAYGLTADGVTYVNAAAESHLVRPALHLNLTSAAQAANAVDKPTASDKTVVYNGQQQTFDLGIKTADVTQNKVQISVATDNGVTVAATDNGGNQVVNATQAGTYTVTVSLLNDYRWENSNNLNDTDSITLTFKIEKRKVTLDVTIPEGVLSTLPYGTSFNLSSGSSSVRDYWKYTTGTSSATDSTYTQGTNYQFVNNDENKLTVTTPTANQSTGAFLTPGNYPLYVEISATYKTEMDKNYDISFKGDFDGSGEYSTDAGKAATVVVTKAELTITPKDVSVGYGVEATDNGADCVGFAEGEGISDLSGSLHYAFGTYSKDTAKVGETYTITVSGCTSDNYEIHYGTGTLTVTPKKISLQISSTSRTYGSTDMVSFGVNSSGDGVWVNDEDEAALLQLVTFTLNNGAVTLSSTLEVGTYQITATDGVYGNYDVVFTAGEFRVTNATIQAASGAYTLAGANYNYMQGTSTLITHQVKVNEGNFTLAGGMTATFTYSQLKKGGQLCSPSDYSLSDGVFSVWNVGEYTVLVTVTAPNHDTIENHEVSFTISPTQISVSLSSQQITRQYSDVIGNVNDMVFGELTVSASGFGGNVEALKKTLTFKLNNAATLNSTLTVGEYALEVEAADSGFTLTGNTTFDNKVKITYANIDVDDVNWELVFTYALNSSSQPVKYALEIDKARVKTVGSVDFEVKYDNFIGAGAQDVDDQGIYWASNAGNYSIRVTITAVNHETLVRTLYVTINKATATVVPSYDSGAEIWTSGSLPTIGVQSATVNGRAVNGSISWTTSLGSVQQDGYSDFAWQWIPENDNIEIATGTIRLYVRFAAVRGVSIQFDPGDRVFYDTDPINDLKNYLTVTVTFTDGNSRMLGMNEYTLTCLGESYLTAGESVSITVTYMSAGSPVTQSFSAKVVKNPNTGNTDDPNNPSNPNNPNNPNNPGGGNDNDGPTFWEKVQDWFKGVDEWFEQQALPFGYVAAVLGLELFLIIILAIAARKPKA